MWKTEIEGSRSKAGLDKTMIPCLKTKTRAENKEQLKRKGLEAWLKW
jgi:hypothetical protein